MKFVHLFFLCSFVLKCCLFLFLIDLVQFSCFLSAVANDVLVVQLKQVVLFKSYQTHQVKRMKQNEYEIRFISLFDGAVTINLVVAVSLIHVSYVMQYETGGKAG